MIKQSFLSIFILVAVGCQSNAQQGTRIHSESFVAVNLVVTSTAFQNGSAIPKQFSCDSINISPALAWSWSAGDTKSYALICEDPDAPMGTFIHWVIYNIPPSERGLPENIPTKDSLPNGTRQGKNGANKTGYTGPCPPPGKVHHYHFKLYGLDEKLNLTGVVTKQEVMNTMNGHIVAMGELVGTYQR
jgi:Raf kinase inhibitor-like YbhB/YbcL family protein